MVWSEPFSRRTEMDPDFRSISASLIPQTSDALRPCLYASRIIAQSRVARFRAALSRASVSWGVRMVMRPRLIRIGGPFRIEIGITAGFAMGSFLGFWGFELQGGSTSAGIRVAVNAN